MPKLKINFTASGPKKKFECNDFDFKECLKVAARMKLPLEKALLDPFFYYLKMPIASTEHLPGTKWSVYWTLKNQIEIWYDGKKIKKYIADIDQDLLFPIYNKTKIEIRRI
jgi:hypothetical protein